MLRILLSLCCLALLPGMAIAHVIQIPATQLPGLLEEPTTPYSFFSVRGGRFEPVPHQWLEFSADGIPWFAKDSSSRRAGKAGVISPSDRLLLRRSDGGERLSGRATEQVVAEVEVKMGSDTFYYYAVRNAYRQATQRYVRFDQQRMVVRSTDYSLSMEPGNMLIWNDFFYRTFETPSGKPESILDTLKIRMSAGVFSENARVTLTNQNLEPRIEEVIEGPLAWVVYATTTLTVARVPVMRMRNYFLLMPQQTDIHTRFTLPTVARSVLTPPTLSISLDGNQLYGSQLVTSWTGDKVAITDGKISAAEQAMIDTPMSGRNWLWFGTGRGFDLLAQVDFLEGFERPVRLHYQDDATLANPPERFPGQLPNVGFTIEQIPIGQEFYFLASLYFSENSNNMPPGQYANEILDAPQITWRSTE
ncbi:MAG: hypothetical protein CVV10_06645 [Gammaproteobacteria bacterium HGW-Gammaproteobacteria-14]|nr:MAG: hypothetical protein CVV10_06645 [Gammaproteobacteria bacterium HGW-Gammaproteobacteria-14]